jgi:hypothetical protein
LPTDNTWTGINTFNNDVVINESGTSDALRITNTGTGNSLVVEDSANPDSTPFVVTNAGNVGIGTNAPASLLHIEGGNATVQRYSNSGAIVLRRANGTATVPTAVLASEASSIITTRAYDGVSTYKDIAGITIYAAENITPTAAGGIFTIFTTPIGSVSSSERFRIDNAGNVFLGTNTTPGQNTGGLTIQGKDIELMTIMDAY